MDTSRKLAEGIGAWLQFQFACNNSDLFCEQFLIEPIGRILSSLTAERVIAEFKHPIFAPLHTGKGRRPSVDFVVCDPYPTVKFAVESKWVGKSKPSISGVLWDLIRLEQISHADGAQCFFILGGKKRSLDTYLNAEQFNGPSDLKRPHPLLMTKSTRKYELHLTADVLHRRETVKRLLNPYQEHPFPQRIHTRLTNPFPPECKASQFQVYVWEISSKPTRDIFYPKNSKHYATSN